MGLPSILVVDDDPSLRRVVEFHLCEAGYQVRSAGDGEEALTLFREGSFDLVLTDLLMPGLNGMDLLERVRALRPETVVVMITAHGDVATAVKAMQLGALDFLEKPFTRERLLVAVRRAAELRHLRDENRRLRALVQEHGEFENMVGTSVALKDVLADLTLAASSDATVLVLGESGTGKELAARALHLNSRRKDGPFVVVNCASIPETLIESQLFGHRKGAFTGATEDQEGKFEIADGGTIFLDEIGELPLALQPRLLRVLQEGEVDKVGAATSIPVDVRVVASTHQDLEARVRDGEFREDLWYRLNVVPLRMPPLRERLEDLPLLVERFLLKGAKRHSRPVPRIAPEAIDLLMRHDWPGNIRELENLLERLIVLSRSGAITPEDLPASFRGESPSYGGLRIEIPPAGIVLGEVEKGLLQEALRKSGGNQSQAARLLGISRQTLLYRMKKFEL